MVAMITVPAPSRSCIRISLGYKPAAVRYTLIVDPAAAVNVEEVGPAPVQDSPVKTATPLTDTATVPPFQPSPHVSVLRMVCVHDCESTDVLIKIKKMIVIKDFMAQKMFIELT
jgi:hypothetical protein